MVVPATEAVPYMKPEAIIFDCFGVLYADNESLLRRHVLNTELVVLITQKLKPDYKVGLLSNIGREWINNFISKHQLDGLFDAVIVSGDEGIAKPHPSIYRRISEELGVKPEKCLMIDDLIENCDGAENAGMQSIHFASNDRLVEDLRKLSVVS